MSRPVANRLSTFATILVAALACGAGPASARTSDRNQPMDLDANSSDCSADDNGPCVFTGGVHIVQGSLDIRAAKADVRRGGGDIRRVLLSGAPVLLKQQMDNGSMLNARASNIDYNMPTDTVIFTGDAQIDQPGHGTITSERIVYNMKTGQVQSGGQGNGRVKMRLLPKNAQPAAAKPEPKT